MSVYGYNLPIEQQREEILKAVESSRVCVIKGPTGCGKSSYIPYLLSQCGGRVAVVEPRRIAVLSLYRTLMNVVENVGYKMRFERMGGRNSKIMIYTDGSFLNELNHCNFDYIVIDEVHERSIRTDAVLALLRSGMGGAETRVVLMSATVDTERMMRYFRAKVLEIRTQKYPVRIEYTAECVSDYIVEAYSVVKRIAANGEECIDGMTVGRDILVFLPGEEDINELYVLLRKLVTVKVYRVFSALGEHEQSRIYEYSNLRKVILSTNICETSLTIPGVGYVIDSGLHKIRVYDGISYLGILPVSAESAEQRLGRCNRTGPGVCYRLYPEHIYNTLPHQVPEICRSDLSHLFLQLLSNGRDVLHISLLEYPPASLAKSALLFLHSKKCITNEMEITNYGRILARYPFDVHLSHFYQQAISAGVGCLASALVSLVSQENFNFMGNGQEKHKTDVEFLVSLLEGYIEAENKKRYCIEREVPQRGMERAARILVTLNRGGERDMQMLERVFSSSYAHNICERIEDGSYRHIGSGEIVWIHPKSCFFKRKDRRIVFVDVFHTGKAYARVVGRYIGQTCSQ